MLSDDVRVIIGVHEEEIGVDVQNNVEGSTFTGCLVHSHDPGGAGKRIELRD